ncbi:MAG TPA: sialidase family protein [Thermoanaerobaculia bacterium]|nr:sialidase family protein [Thermoanaerobaculia bacterium]
MKATFAQADPTRPKRHAAIRALALLLSARNLCVLMLLCAVAGSGGCSGFGRRPASALSVADPIDHLDSLAREPMVVEHPDGTLFVSGYGASAPTLWKSSDHGANWMRVHVGNEADGALGNSDVDLAVAPDGTLYFVAMVFDREALEGRSISIGVSKDVGMTWSWTLLSETRFDDRPWVEVAPDGTAHVIWNDGDGVCHAVSRDGGITWTERPRIHAQGGSSHLAVGPHGELAVRVTPLSASGNRYDEGIDILAISSDGGATWQKRAAPGQREWSPMQDNQVPPRWVEPALPRWVEPLAWDAEGALYSLWSNQKGLWLAQSRDQGVDWTSWHMDKGADVLYFPYLIARGHGELAGTWFSGVGEKVQAHVGLFKVGDGDAPRLIQSKPIRLNAWRQDVRDTGGEYLAMTFLRTGGLGVVSPVQNQQAEQFGFSWWKIEVR